MVTHPGFRRSGSDPPLTLPSETRSRDIDVAIGMAEST